MKNGRVAKWLVVLLLAIGACTLDASGNKESSSTGTGGTDTGTGGSGANSSSANGGTGGSAPCTPGDTISCYSGPSGTEGKGVCVPGIQACTEDGAGYGDCVGEITPVTEDCTTNVDDDCDSSVNDGCSCVPGATASCYSGPEGTLDVGPCVAGAQTCTAQSVWGECLNQVLPVTETCDNDVDDDCDGAEDDGCICAPNETRACYNGAPGTDGVGPCHGGTQDCNPDGKSWGPCIGEVVPVEEACNFEDDDCDGRLDDIALPTPRTVLTDVPDASDPSIAMSGGVLGFGWTESDVNDDTVTAPFFGTADLNGDRILGDTSLPTAGGMLGRDVALTKNGAGYAALYVDTSFATFATITANGVVAKSPNTVGGRTNVVGTDIAGNANGTRFLGTWGIRPEGLNGDVYTGVWDAVGNLVSGGMLSNTNNQATDPHVVWNGNSFKVCWIEDAGTLTPTCQTVNSNGVPQGSAATLGIGAGLDFHLVWNGAGYAAAWRTPGSGNNLVFARFDQNMANPVLTQVPLPNGATVDAVDLGWNGTEYAVASISTDGAVHSAAAVRISANGVLAETNDLSQWSDPGTSGTIRIAWDGVKWVAVWDDDDLVIDGRVIVERPFCD